MPNLVLTVQGAQHSHARMCANCRGSHIVFHRNCLVHKFKSKLTGLRLKVGSSSFFPSCFCISLSISSPTLPSYLYSLSQSNSVHILNPYTPSLPLPWCLPLFLTLPVTPASLNIPPHLPPHSLLHLLPLLLRHVSSSPPQWKTLISQTSLPNSPPETLEDIQSFLNISHIHPLLPLHSE